MEKWSKDGLLLQRRSGNSDSPYVSIDESVRVDGFGRAILREIPSEFHGVFITGDGEEWLETKNNVDNPNHYKVDYLSGIVTFNIENQGKQLNFSYKGTGQTFSPASRIYTKREGQTVIETLESLTERAGNQADLVDMILKTGNVSSINGKTGIVDGLVEDGDYIPFKEQTIEKTDGILKDLEERALNVMSFGAKANGVSNDTKFIQAAIDKASANGGGIVEIPAGHYRAKGIRVPSNVTVRGAGNSTLLEATTPGGYLFLMVGELGEGYPFSEDKTIGDTAIKTTGSHHLKVGDSVMIVSQRDCLSDDAGKRWRLGKGTPGVTHAYFGEFKDIRRVVSNNEVILSSSLQFPDYFRNSTRENSPYAGDSAVLKKIDFVESARVESLRAEGEFAGILNIRYGRNCTISHVDWVGGHEGGFAVIKESFACTGEHLTMKYKYTKDPSDHYKRNPLKVISSHLCGFSDCRVVNATQALDFTFDTGLICCAYNFMKNCIIIDALDNSATSHGGTYASVFQGNIMIGCRKGISTRSRNSQVTDNFIVGNRNQLATYGISIFEGWSRDSIVSNNTVIGFGRGIEITESNGGYFDYNGAIIDGNTIQECNHGIDIRRFAGNKYVGDSNIKIANNTIKDFYGYGGNSGKGVNIAGYVHGVKIMNNSIILNEYSNGAIYFNPNASFFYVENNLMLSGDGTGGRSIWTAKPDDSELFPDGRVRGYMAGNSYEGLSIPNTDEINLNLGSRNVFGILSPALDDEWSLGWSGRRWKSVFSKNGTIQTSDERQKDFIEEIPNDWLDAWSEVEYKRFKFKSAIQTKGEGARWHVGVVAQQIFESFATRGVNALDIGILGYDEWSDDETGEDKNIWSIRADECLFLESALMRRELDNLRK